MRRGQVRGYSPRPPLPNKQAWLKAPITQSAESAPSPRSPRLATWRARGDTVPTLLCEHPGALSPA